MLPAESPAEKKSPKAYLGDCVVCGDLGTGRHYGVVACEGCKGFFKRSIRRKMVYTCLADFACPVGKGSRNRCQSCRIDKCLRMGMRKEAVQCERKPVAVATASRISPPSAPTAKPKKSRRRRGISRTQSFKPESLPSPDVGPKRVRGATKRVRAVTSGGESADLKRSSYSSLGISEAQSLGPQLPSSSGAQSLPSPDVGQKRVRGATKRMRAVSSGGESDDWQPISYGPPGSSAAKSLGPQLSPSSGAQSLPSPDVGQKRVRGATKRMRAVSSGGESADLKRSSCSSLGSSEAQSLGPPLPPSSGTQSLPSSDVGQKGVRGASKRIRAFSSGGESADLKRSSCGPLESSEAQSLGSQWPPSKEAGDESPPWISASSFLENTSQFPPAQGLGPEMVGVLPLPTLAPHQSPGVSAPGQEHSPSPPTSLPAQSPGSQLSPSGVLTAQMVNDVPTSTVLPHQSCSGASLVQRPSHDPQIEVTRGSVPTQSPGSQSPPSQNSGGQIVNVFFTPPGLQHSGSVGARYSGDNDSPPAMPAAGPSPPAPPRSESLQPRMQADAPTDVSADVVSREVQHFQVAPMNLPLYTSLSNFVCEFSVRVLILSFKWASTVPAFKRLVRDDQLALLQHCWSNIFLFGLLQNASGIPLSSFLMSAATHLEHRQGDSWPLFGRSATDQVSAIQDFFSTLENLHVDHVEYAYLRAIMIFNPDCPELQQPLDVSSSQGKAFHSLQAYTKKRCPGQPRRMFDLLARLTAAKAIPVEVVGELFFSAVDGHIGHGGMMVRLLFEGL